MSTPGRRGFTFLLTGLVLGVVLLGASAYVIKATDKRQFCAQCHSMMPSAVTQKVSTHVNLECNECHLPQNVLYRYPYKAYIGMYDIFAENFKDVELPIMADTLMKDVINENCKACHTATNMEVATMESKRYCTDCHRNVPHQRMQPISTRMVAYE